MGLFTDLAQFLCLTAIAFTDCIGGLAGALGQLFQLARITAQLLAQAQQTRLAALGLTGQIIKGLTQILAESRNLLR